MEPSRKGKMGGICNLSILPIQLGQCHCVPGSQAGELGTNCLAGFHAPATRFRALLTVVMVVGSALVSAPFADLGTEATEFCCEFAVDRHDIDACLANSRTFEAAFWASVIAFFAQHGDYIGQALCGTSLAGFNA